MYRQGCNGYPLLHISPIRTPAISHPVSGILGELGYMSIGVGYTDTAFQMFAAQWVKQKTGGKPERIECAGCCIQADVSETLLPAGKGE